MSKVSFDFDETLDREDVQEYCKYLQSKNVEIYVTTSRCSEEYFPQASNWDLYEVLEQMNIPLDNLIMCNYSDKYDVIGDLDFLWHLDDSIDVVNEFNNYTKIKGIYVKNKDWRKECESYF